MIESQASRRRQGPMAFRYRQLAHLPRLAWCARLQAGSPEATVYHGRDVEVVPDRFIEGAWNADFSSNENLADATVICGTGGCLRDDAVWFTSSTDRICPIFSLIKGDAIYVSNSPMFVLSASGERPDPVHPFYPYDWIRMWRAGLHWPAGPLRTASSIPFRIHFSTMLAVDRFGNVRFQPHRLCEAPRDFHSYRELLARSLEQVFRHAGDPARRRTYAPLAAISKGYDSNATAAVARRAGCRQTVTFRDSRNDEPDRDIGVENARHLGMDCAVFDRWDYLSLDGKVEPEFAIFPISATTPIAGMEDSLRGRLLITGHFGECIWDPKMSPYCGDLSLPWARMVSGVSQIEFRLRVGFLVMAPSYVGARHNDRIHEITMSPEMREWWVGGDYDRPIARRLAEEQGVPRRLVGWEKMGIGHNHFAGSAQFSPAALENYQQFLRRSHASASRPRYHLGRALVEGRHWSWKMTGFKERRYVSSSKWQRRFPFLLNAKPLRIPFKFLFTFQWAFDCLQERYRLENGGPTDRSADASLIASSVGQG